MFNWIIILVENLFQNKQYFNSGIWLQFFYSVSILGVLYLIDQKADLKKISMNICYFECT